MPSIPIREPAANPVVAGPPRTLRFAGTFFAIVAAFYVLTLSPWVDAKALFPVMKASARGSSLLLNLAGFKTTVAGVVVRGPGYAVAVRRGCDPLEPIVLFGAGVLAFPAAWGRRFAGLLIGGGLLFFLNAIRIASLFLLGAGKSSLCEDFHLYWWPGIFVICALALWVLWLRAIPPGAPART